MTSWDEIIHMSQFFLMEFNKTNFLGTSSALNWRKPEVNFISLSKDTDIEFGDSRIIKKIT